MRKKEQEITSLSDIENIIEQAQMCRIGLSDNGIPYVVPVCFGYKDNVLFFHCALEGRKIDIIRENNTVCFQVETDVAFIKGDIACKWGFKYRSVIGTGKGAIITDFNEKENALGIIMAHYSDKSFNFIEEAVNRTCVVRIDIDEMTGKQSGY